MYIPYYLFRCAIVRCAGCCQLHIGRIRQHCIPVQTEEMSEESLVDWRYETEVDSMQSNISENIKWIQL